MRNLLVDPDATALERRDELAAALDRYLANADPLPSEFFPRKSKGGGPQDSERRAMWERLEAMGYISDEETADE